MKIDEIKAIVKLMTDNDLTEFKIESEEMTLRLRRGSRAPVSVPVIAAAPAAPAAAPAAPAAPVPAAAPATPEPASAVPAKVIESPMVGTFYRSNTPGGDPLVKVGSKVTPDTVVCLIETMKVMNEIKAEQTGVIKEIKVENGDAVGFGQPLFILE